jgi:hypothetical protein
MLARTLLVKGTMEMTARNVKREHTMGNGLSVGDLQAILGPAKDNIVLWKTSVSEEFAAVWDAEVSRISKGKGKPSIDVDEEANLYIRGRIEARRLRLLVTSKAHFRSTPKRKSYNGSYLLLTTRAGRGC